ncbi:MAG: hypothetical protein V7K14_04230 [Nostoc sp.]|uniref:hypothetical protein n=1 Tax=Nostoc sp. TaxID=1180 RepID=UPI002FF812E5
MKTRNAFATLTICVLSALTITDVVNMHKVSAHTKNDCRQLVTGTYLTKLSGDFGSSFGITTFTEDGNFVTSASAQSVSNPSFQPFGNVQGRWKCTSGTEITATGLNFSYPTTTLPGNFTRSDFRATFDPKAGIVKATATLKFFSLNANPLNDYAPVAVTFTFTGQRVKAGE